MKSRGNRQAGVATIEFVIAAPVLVLIMLAVAEIGRALNQYNTLTQSVQDGARYAAGEAINNSLRMLDVGGQVATTTKNLVVYGEPLARGEPLLPGWTPDAVDVLKVDEEHVRVTADFTYSPMFGGQLPTFGITDQPIRFEFRWSASVQMRAI